MHTSSLFDLSGQVAVVTGAPGRLGREISFALAEMGADLVIVARTESALQALEEELIARTGRRVLSLAADLHHADVIGQVFGRVADFYGRLDVLVNNATGNARESVEDMPEATWNSALERIVSNMFLCCQAAGPLMRERRSGSIINLASVYGVVAADPRIYGDSGLNSSVVYGAGKAAVLQLTRYLAAYWAQAGIRVNSLTPGGVEDSSNDHAEFRRNYQGRTPMQRMMQRDEIRGPVVFLASRASSYMTGHNLIVDGGFTIV